MPFYAVAHGYQRGVFEDWAETQKQITDFPQPSYKKFDTREEAEKFVAAAMPARVEYVSPEEESDKWYAVARGKVVGVFTKWDAVQTHIEGYPQAMHKKFESYDEAKAYVEKFYEGKLATDEEAAGEEKEKKEEVKATEAEKPAKKEKKKEEVKPTEAEKLAKRETRSSDKGGKSVTYYAVARGKQTGVFTDWSECKAATTGFKGAKFKKFDNEEEAKMFAEGKTLKQIADAKRKHTDSESGEEVSPPKKTKKAAKA